jgi:hypothetical protein
MINYIKNKFGNLGESNKGDESNIKIDLPYELRGKSINSEKIIPTVYNLKNTLVKLIEANGDYNKLKQWEKRSYKHYCIDEIYWKIQQADEKEKIQILRNHILNNDFTKLGASPFDIYIVAYISEKIGVGRGVFENYCLKNGLAGTPNSAMAIYQVGKGDGVYLKILNEDGTVRDWAFMKQWIGN